MREEIVSPFFWVLYNQFSAHVSAGSNIWCYKLVINFMSKWLRERMFEDFYCIISLILSKLSCCGSNCYISFSVFYHWFCAQLIARAVMISRVTASRSGMCGVLAFVLLFSLILKVNAFFLDHFTSFNWNCFSLVFIRFSCCSLFCSQITIWPHLHTLCS